MSIADKLQTIKTIKENIKTSINNKGGNVGDNFNEYATAIDNISAGGSSKISIKDIGLKFGNATFTEVPENFDFSGIKDLSEMFYNCKNLTHIPEMNTENVTTMYRMCYGTKIKTIPLLNTSNVKDISQMFYACKKLETIPAIDTTNVTSMGSLFASCTNLTTVPPLRADSVSGNLGLFGYDILNNLINFGGLINIKANLSDNYGFIKCPNLSYESCINILNGLADVTDLGGRTLKVHQNFLDLVGDKISIATNKGWVLQN